MCLYTKRGFYKKAKEDIIVYKVMFFLKENNYLKSTTCCTYEEYKFNTLYVADGGSRVKDVIQRIKKMRYVDQCFFHSFKNLKDAKTSGSQSIVECIIPKGTKYYEGLINEDEIKGYASRKIIFTRIINN